MSTGFDARPYQQEMVDRTVSCFRGGTRAALAVMATGLGKTVCATMLSRRCLADRVASRPRVLFLAHRYELIQQSLKAFRRAGISAQVEMGSQRASRRITDSEAVIATVQTLSGDRLASWEPDSFGLVITDEAHHCRAAGYRAVYGHFRDYLHLGLTATPGRGDRRNLGAVYEERCFGMGIEEATPDWLAPLVPQTVRCGADLRDLYTSKGSRRELNAGDLGEAIAPHVEEFAYAIRAEVGDRQTVVFCPDVGSSAAVAQALRGLGVASKYVAGSGGRFGMRRAERKEVLAEYDRCDVQALVCCDLLIEGWDNPATAAVAILRPTPDRYRYAQMVGRGTRPCPEAGKSDCLVLDFDWETPDECRSLCSLVDLYDDGEAAIPARVLALAKTIVRDEGLQAAAAIKEARRRVSEGDRAKEKTYKAADVAASEDCVRSRPNLDVRISGKKCKYEKWTRSPKHAAKMLGVKLSPKAHFDTDGRNPISDKQRQFLLDRGVEEPEKLSRWGASQLIGEIIHRQRGGLANLRQVDRMLKSGLPELQTRTMSYEDARRRIREHRKQRAIGGDRL